MILLPYYQSLAANPYHPTHILELEMRNAEKIVRPGLTPRIRSARTRGLPGEPTNCIHWRPANAPHPLPSDASKISSVPPPVCDTKSPTIPVTHYTITTYHHQIFSLTFRILRHNSQLEHIRKCSSRYPARILDPWKRGSSRHYKIGP